MKTGCRPGSSWGTVRQGESRGQIDLPVIIAGSEVPDVLFNEEVGLVRSKGE